MNVVGLYALGKGDYEYSKIWLISLLYRPYLQKYIDVFSKCYYYIYFLQPLSFHHRFPMDEDPQDMYVCTRYMFSGQVITKPGRPCFLVPDAHWGRKPITYGRSASNCVFASLKPSSSKVFSEVLPQTENGVRRPCINLNK